MSNKSFENCNKLLQQIVEDPSVPRNIRRAAKESKKLLVIDDNEPCIRANTVLSILDEISNDPNIPIHTRTLIWEVLSELESI